MKSKSLAKIFILGIFAISLCSCAFGTREVELGYPPEKRSESGVAYASENSKSKKILLVKIKNERSLTGSSSFEEATDKEIIGHVRNTFGMKTANVVTDINIEEWVFNAIALEFKNRNNYIGMKDTIFRDEEPTRPYEIIGIIKFKKKIGTMKVL